MIIPILLFLVTIGVFFSIPISILIINYICSFLFFIYKKKNINKYSTVNAREFWNTPCTYVSKFWYFFGKVYHGYEIHGLEQVPSNGPAIFVLYHPPSPIDACFILSAIFLKLKRKPIAIVERMIFKFPGYQTFLEGVEHIPGTIDSCVSMLKKGEIFLIYPGGVNEGLKSNGYNLLWKANAGFAKLAQQAKVPVIPLFTKNTRQVSAEISFIGKLIPIGWFPVKLQTFVGERIEYNENRSVEELVSMVKSSLVHLINRHQEMPSSVTYALFERLISDNSINEISAPLNLQSRLV